MMRDLRQDIETALVGDAPDRITLSYYDTIFPRDIDMRPLLANSLLKKSRG